ncbi:MAG: hypothetical protein C4K58_06095 [Flavobacteriaceae bacterium]|nr:MAG: hypothetical protein C4K58_06095 [Flavobacteriaceae bacterium]
MQGHLQDPMCIVLRGSSSPLLHKKDFLDPKNKKYKPKAMEQNKNVSYNSTNSYLTIGNLNPNTQNIWLIFHGFGQTAAQLIPFFEERKEDYLIFLQAPSKFYFQNFSKIGSSWLTQMDLEEEKKNILAYVSAVVTNENLIHFSCPINWFGFSQGVSVLFRSLSFLELPYQKIVVWAGQIPKEISKETFKGISTESSEVFLVYGDKDPLIDKDKKQEQILKAKDLFSSYKEISFEGEHQLDFTTLQRFR